MGYYVALDKNIQNGVIKGYSVKAPNGEIVYVDKQSVKNAIKSGQAIFINLMIDKSGRLISSSEHITGKLKIVAEAIKSITKDNYTDIELKSNCMETQFNNYEYMLSASLDCSRIVFLYKDNSCELKSKDDVIRCANIVVNNRKKYDKPKELNIDFNNKDNTIIILKSDIRNLYNYAYCNSIMGDISNEYTNRINNMIKCAEVSFKVAYNEIFIKVKPYGDCAPNIIYIADAMNTIDITFVDSVIDNMLIKHKEGTDNPYINIERTVVNNLVYKDTIKPLFIKLDYVYIKNADISFGSIIRSTGMPILFNHIVFRRIYYTSCRFTSMFGNTLEIYNDKDSILISDDADNAIENIKLVSNKHIKFECEHYLFARNIDIITKSEANIWIQTNDGHFNNYSSLPERLAKYKPLHGYNISKRIDSLVNEYDANSLINAQCKLNITASDVFIRKMIGDIVTNVETINNHDTNDKLVSEIRKQIPLNSVMHKLSNKIKLYEKGALFISNGCNWSVDSIIIDKSFKGNDPDEKVGILFNENKLKDFSITILNSIKTTSRSENEKSLKNLHIILEQLQKISEIKPINVMYGTQAYMILTNANVNINILNKDDMPENLIRRSTKEKVLGSNALEKLHNELSSNTLEHVSKTINIEAIARIPEEYYKFFDVAEASKDTKVAISDDINNILAIKLLRRFKQIPELFDKGALNELMGAKYSKELKTEIIAPKSDIKIKKLIIADEEAKELEFIYIVLYKDLVLACAYASDFLISANIQLSTTEEYLRALNGISQLDTINFDSHTLKQELTLNKYDKESYLIDAIKVVIKNSFHFYSINKKLAVFPIQEDNYMITSIRATVKKGGLVLGSKFSSKYINELNSITIQKEKSFNDIIDYINDKYRDSTIIRLLNNRNKNTKENNSKLPEAEISLIYQFCTKYEGSILYTHKYRGQLAEDIIKEMFKLPMFTHIRYGDLEMALKGVKYIQRKVSSSIVGDKIDLQVLELIGSHSEIDKCISEYQACVKYVYILSDSTSTDYILSQFNILKLIDIFAKILIGKNSSLSKYTVEDYINYIGMAQVWKLDEFYKSIMHLDFKSVINNYAYEYKDLLIPVFESSTTWYQSGERRRGKMPKDEVKLDRKPMICVDSTTGVMYLCISLIFDYEKQLGGMKIPLLRLKNFRTACKLYRDMYRVERNRSMGLHIDMLVGETNLCVAILNQYNNNDNRLDYGNKFQYTGFLAKKSVTAIYESPEETLDNPSTDTKNSNILKGYSLGILMKYVNMGGISIIPDIPTSYKLCKTLIAEGSNEQIDEYRDANSEYIIYDIRGLIIKTEFELQELLDI